MLAMILQGLTGEEGREGRLYSSQRGNPSRELHLQLVQPTGLPGN